MTYQTKIKWSFISAILASICWVIGDIYVAGFEVNPTDYPLFSETYADKVNVGLGTLMLEGSSGRLMFGALIAAMTATLFLPAIWLAMQYIKDRQKWYAWTVYFILIVSVLLMPLGHAVFFFTGEVHKAILHTDPVAHPYLLEMASNFMTMHYITWGTAIIVLFIGWIFYAVLVFSGKTSLPRWAGFITPFLLTLYQQPIIQLIPSSTLRGWIVGAGFNISYLIFFVLLLFLFRKRMAISNLKEMENGQ